MNTFRGAMALSCLYRRSTLALLAVALGLAAMPGRAQADTAVSSGAETSSSDEDRVQQVTVTAERKKEQVLDVPIPIAAVNAPTLTEDNLVRLKDYYAQVPGLQLTQGATYGTENLSIRGISNLLAGVPTVGIQMDDAPFGGSASGGFFVPDVDPGDLARVEVLRGPQGTLYGEGSMGGLVKYVTLDPSPSGFSGRAQVGTSGVVNGSELGYNARGSANVPLSANAALLLSGFEREDPGYIDDVETGQNQINARHSRGGHLALLWHLSEDWSLKVSALYQDTSALSLDSVDPAYGDLNQSRARGAGVNDSTIQSYSAVFDGKMGGIEFKSISAYNSVRTVWNNDYSPIFGSLIQPIFGVTGVLLPGLDTTDRVSQEFQFSGSMSQRIDWLVGLFYTHEYTGATDYLEPEDPVTGAIVPGGTTLLSHEEKPSSYVEHAIFANFTYHFTERLDVQIGGRESRSTVAASQTDVGPLLSFVTPENAATADAFTYLFTPRYKISSDLMVYLRLASGFRAGGFNANSIDTVKFGTPVPPSYAPDKTYDYDLGLKGDLLDHRLFLDASLYYIEWKNIQQDVSTLVNGANFGYITNAGGAESEGVELSATAKPFAGMTVSGWITSDRQVLSQAFPASAPVVGASGDRLPYTSRYSGSLSLQQDFPLWGDTVGFVGGTVSYVGDRLGYFKATGVARQDYPAYAQADLRAGVKFGPWIINAFVNNVADRRGLLFGGADTGYPANNVHASAFYIEPRLIGLNVLRSF